MSSKETSVEIDLKNSGWLYLNDSDNFDRIEYMRKKKELVLPTLLWYVDEAKRIDNSLNTFFQLDLLELLKNKSPEYSSLDKNVKEVLDSECYFCGYDLFINKHHILFKVNKGRDIPINRISLCPNCHSLIHNKIAKLTYSNLRFWLVAYNGTIIYRPSIFQIGVNRILPLDWKPDQKMINMVDVIDDDGLCLQYDIFNNCLN
jgi:hypothetical protein